MTIRHHDAGVGVDRLISGDSVAKACPSAQSRMRLGNGKFSDFSPANLIRFSQASRVPAVISNCTRRCVLRCMRR